MNNSMHMSQSVHIVVVLLSTTLLLCSCQTPTETPPTTQRDVTVHVQDAEGRALEGIPVQLHVLEDNEMERLDTRSTDRMGNAQFDVFIPTTGRAFRFVIGTETTGRVFLDANLLCRDTVLVARMAAERLPCGDEISKVLRIGDICAPLVTGQRFTDSTQHTFTNTCDEALTFTVTGPDSEDISLVLLDTDGSVIVDRPFIIPASGQFVVRAIATPSDSGLQDWSFVFTGSGANQAMTVLRLDVEVDARNCNVCECPEEVIVVDFGFVEAHPVQGEGRKSVTLPRNICNFVRVDNLIQTVTQPQRFGVPPIENMTLQPGDSYARNFSFVPAPGDFTLVEDYVLIEHWIEAEGKTCTTMVILRGQGCGPVCRLIDDAFESTGENSWKYDFPRVRVYESGSGRICVENMGECGDLVIEKRHDEVSGFSVMPEELRISEGSSGCFTVVFNATDDVVWPDGHGQPAIIEHMLPIRLLGCGPENSIDVHVLVDTLPAQFSRCIYQWDQNGNFGYNFTPVAGKGEDHFDPDPLNSQISDMVVLNASTGNSADVRLRSGWKFIKADVTEAQFNFADMSDALNGWSRAEYLAITTGTFNTPGVATLNFRSVYSVQIEREGTIYYACVRVREISADSDGKYKICLDVLFPMIKE
ncbi:MAG: hypothetical protein KFH87_13475 [Bacteroidetes bacterium]|nr:hypothetical protein [Bacteroidota bacterium]